MVNQEFDHYNVVTYNDTLQPRHPHWYAMVKNTEAGRLWLRNFKSKNRHIKITVRGRHSDRKLVYKLTGRDYIYRTQNDVPLAYAQRLAVYVFNK